MFALVLQIPNENRTGFSIVHLYKRPRTENTACAKRVRPFAKIRTGESKSKLACILPGGRIFDEVKGTNNSGKAAETGPPEAFFQPNVIFSARKCAKIKNMSIFAVPKQRFWVGRTGQVLLPRPKRRGAGVVDRAALEMRCTGNCTGGSNPSLSATNAENQQIAKQTPSFAPKNVKSGVFVLFKIIQPLHNKRVAILKESDEKRLIFIYPFSLIFQDFTSSWKYFLLYPNIRSGL